MASLQPIALKESLPAKLLTKVFSVYLVVTILLTSFHLVAEYQNTQELVLRELEGLSRSFNPGLSLSVWNEDENQARSIAAGILESPSIVKVQINPDWGVETQEIVTSASELKPGTLVADAPPQSTTESPSDTATDGLLEQRLFGATFPIVYVTPEQSPKNLGTITLFSDHSIVFSKVQHGFVFIFVNALLKTLALWAIFLWYGRHLLSLPLRRLTSATQQFRSEALENLPHRTEFPEVDTQRSDELGILANVFQDMRDALLKHIQELEGSREKIRQYNQELEHKVEARTLEIQRSHQELTQLHEVAHTVNLTLNLDEVMSVTQKSLQPVFSFDIIGIAIVDDALKALRPDRVYGEDVSDEEKAHLHEVQIPLDNTDSFFVRMLFQKDPEFIPQITPKFQRTFSQYDQQIFSILPICGFLCFPLEIQFNTIGVIFFGNRKQPFSLKHQQLETIQHYVTNVATAINNARLYEDLKNTRIQLAESEKIAAMTRTFEKFVPKQFLSRLAGQGIEHIQLGQAQLETVTVLFSDIRAFTTLAETMAPQELLNFLNAYFQRMNEVVHRYDGFIDKLVGDAMMALFDLSQRPEDDVKHAIQCAIAMQQELQVYNQLRQHSGYRKISAGIGLHSGPVVFGTVGSQERMDSTVIGDVVNVASRLEGLTKYYGVPIIASDDTLHSFHDVETISHRLIDWVRVRGRTEPLKIYEIFGYETESLQDLKAQSEPFLQEGLQWRKMRRWDDAIQAFQKAVQTFPQDPVAGFHLSQCSVLQKHPPSDDWNGESIFERK